MRQKVKFLLIFNLFLLSTLLIISGNTAACATSVSITAASAKGTIAVNNTIILQATVLNTFSNSQTRDVGLALPTGLVNQSKLLVKSITISKNSYRFVNFTILINSTGDFELMFYLLSGGAVSSWLIMHLLIESLPTALPSQITINTTIKINNTININNTIPVQINATIPVYAVINVSNTLNNFNNITTLCNTTVYNAIVNNITNKIYNIFLANITNVIYNQFIANITQYFNITQWQQQWQWQNVTIIIPPYDTTQQVLPYMLGGTAILGLFFMGYSGAVFKKKEEEVYETVFPAKTKKQQLGLPTSVIPEFKHQFKFGLGLILAAGISALAIFLLFPALGFDLLVSIVLGFAAASIVFLIVMSFNYPKALIFTLIPIDLGLWFWNWLPATILLGLIVFLLVGFLIYRYLKIHSGETHKTSIIFS
jgi:hypothetical protein